MDKQKDINIFRRLDHTLLVTAAIIEASLLIEIDRTALGLFESIVYKIRDFFEDYFEENLHIFHTSHHLLPIGRSFHLDHQPIIPPAFSKDH